MITIVSVFAIVFLILFAASGYGYKFCPERSFAFQMIIGTACIFGLIEIFDLVMIPFLTTKIPLYIFYALVLIIGAGCSLFRKWKFNLKEISCFFVYLSLMMLIASLRARGEPGFDSAFYLSYVIEGADTLSMTSLNYETGQVLPSVNLLYDFQAFYHLNSFFLWAIRTLYYVVFDVHILTSQIYIWSMMALFSSILYCFTHSCIEVFQIKDGKLKWIVYLFVLGIVGNYYWNNSLSFIGNSYRQLYSSVIVMVIYDSFKRKDFRMSCFVILSILGYSLIAFSSSGLYLCFILYFGLIYMSLSCEMKHRGMKIAILLLPIAQYGLNYVYHYTGKAGFVFSCILLFYLFCIGFDVLFSSVWRGRIVQGLRFILKWLPLAVFGLSVFVWMKTDHSIFMFFDDHSTQDMVWDYFNLSDSSHLFFNVLYFAGALVLLNTKDEFTGFLVYLVLMFINPVNIVLVKEYLAGNVFYRSYETVLNYFTCLLLILSVVQMIKKYRYVLSGMICVLSVFTVISACSTYHVLFNVYDEFDRVYKVDRDELDMLVVLNDYLAYEDRRVTVVSQMDSIKGYIPNIELAFAYRQYNPYELNATDDELLKIFYPRDYIGQIMFEEEPDFHCACDELVQHQIDYVIIDRDEVYDIIDEEYQKVYFLVRDCAELIYENERYALFRFYW